MKLQEFIISNSEILNGTVVFKGTNWPHCKGEQLFG